ncbi:hypothetical protein Dip510_000478 [Elusimicrobium posterum]|uniref:hypothetical protein n=1 Tax=Elusimicrobium posterum TaxID=3116653 RepID=UPI003C7850FE
MNFAAFIKNINPHQVRLAMNFVFALPFLLLFFKINSNFRDSKILDDVKEGDITKLQRFLSGRRWKKRLNKYYYVIINTHTYERHTLLTAAVAGNQLEIVEFLLSLSGTDIDKKYIFSESSFNHREYSPLELAQRYDHKQIAAVLTEFIKGRAIR